MGVMMLVMMLGLVFAFPMPMHGGMGSHGPDTDQTHAPAAVPGPEMDPAREAGEPRAQRDPNAHPGQH